MPFSPFVRRTWNALAFADGKCEALASAADCIPANVVEFSEQQTLTKLQRLVEQTEALTTITAQLFGNQSPEAHAAHALQLILRHDLHIMERQSLAH